MKCPHCQTEFHDAIQNLELGDDPDGFWSLERQVCAACHRLVLTLVGKETQALAAMAGRRFPGKERARYLVRPRAASRPAPSKEVPEEFAADYGEAAIVLTDSPKSSAALSRRCL